jgi:hypothetical protein
MCLLQKFYKSSENELEIWKDPEDETGSGFCPVAGFDISGVEHWGLITMRVYPKVSGLSR